MSSWQYDNGPFEAGTQAVCGKDSVIRVNWAGIGLALLAVLLLSIKIVFGDFPTLFKFLHVVCGQNRYLFDYFCELVYRLLGNREEESQVIHFGKYGYPLLLGKSGVTLQSVPCEMYGKTINDPHRWLEAKDSKDAKKWVEEQSSLAEKTLKDSQAPFVPQSRSSNPQNGLLDSFSKKVIRSSQYVEVDSVFQRGKHYFYFKSTKDEAGEGQRVQLYVTRNITVDAFDFEKGDKHGRLSKADRLLLQAPVVDSVQTALVGTWVDNDGDKLVYALCNDADGDWLTMKIRDVSSGIDEEDFLNMNCHRASTAVTWHNKRTGFFYSCFDGAGPDEEASNLVPAHVKHRVCFHRLGTPQEDDLVIFEGSSGSGNKDKRRTFFVPRMSHDGAYLLLEVLEEDFTCMHYSEGPCSSEFRADAPNRLFYIDVSAFNGRDLGSLGPVRRMVDGNGGKYCWDYVTNIGEDFWIRTNYGAENFRIIRISIPGRDVLDRASQGPDPEARVQFMLNSAWHNSLEWIPEMADGSYLENASIAAQTVLVLKYAKSEAHDVSCFDLTQSLTDSSRRACAELPNPPFGVILGPYSNFYSNSVFYTTKSFSDPGSIWRAKIARSSITHTVEVGFEPVHFRKIPHVDIYNFETQQLHVPCKEHCEVTEEDTDERVTPARGLDSDPSDRGSLTPVQSPPRAGSAATNSPSRSTVGSLPGDVAAESTSVRGQVRSGGGVRDGERDKVPLLLFHTRDLDMDIDDRHANSQGSAQRMRTSTQASSFADRSSSIGRSSTSANMKRPSATSVRGKSCLLYVHGNFGVSILPTFSLPLLLYCKHFDALLCVVQIRGGGEYGREWHSKGKNKRKQNAVDDIISAAEYLIDAGLTCRDKLGVLAGTFGATLVAAALNERPDLFGAVVMEDGVYDLIRSEELNKPMHWYGERVGRGLQSLKQRHGPPTTPTSVSLKQPDSTWSREFGRPGEGEVVCERLLRLSPLHNVRPPGGGETFMHPSLMCITNTVSRVPGAHSHKYVAELQRVWGSKGRGGPVVLQSNEGAEAGEEAGEEAAGQNSNGFEKNSHGVEGMAKKGTPCAESRLQRTVKALYFLAYHTGAVYRDNDNSDSESESDSEGNE